MFGNDRNQLRQVFYDCWRLRQDGKALDALQQTVVGVIEQHPEYHPVLENDRLRDRDYDLALGETNPFLHMSLHIALIEQVSTDRPAGIRDIHRQLALATGSAHVAEHAMMECLSEAIRQAQHRQSAPDEAAYLACLRKLVEND